ncbi:tetratricopeptide repeat protein [Rubrivivax gelatinosus]|uniref:Tetratricopeptide repeat protein n=2 Tax=Rubrivivax gelatinosus TaxID=28068 RepID=A0A4R2MAW7_RUBGE|nr:tetratricopeptide repeat protein [Rubrivivax gelatinosus]
MVLEQAGFDVASMEKYPAFELRPVEKCLQDVSNCEFYVLIVARRYGYVPESVNPEKLSITHLEYLRARVTRKPCFVFMLDAGADWPEQHADVPDSPSGRQLAAFIASLRARHGVGTYVDPASLAVGVLAAINNSRERVLWQWKFGGGVALLAALVTLASIGYFNRWEVNDVSSSQWTKALFHYQSERLSGSAGSANKSTPSRDDGSYAERAIAAGFAWESFRLALSGASILLDQLGFGSRSDLLRRALYGQEVEPLIKALTEAQLPASKEPMRQFVIGSFLEFSGRFDEAMAAYQMAFIADPGNVRYSTAALNLGFAIGRQNELLGIVDSQLSAARRLGSSRDVLAAITGYKGLALFYLARAEEADAEFKNAIALAGDVNVRARVLNDASAVYSGRGDFGRAESALIEASSLYSCALGSGHQLTLNSKMNLGSTYTRQGRVRAAAEVFGLVRKALDGEEFKRNPYPYRIAQERVGAGLVYHAQGQFSQAEEALRAARRMYRDLQLGNSGPFARAGLYLGYALMGSGQVSEAQKELESTVGLDISLFGVQHSETLEARLALARAHLMAGDADSAQNELVLVSHAVDDARSARFTERVAAISRQIEVAQSVQATGGSAVGVPDSLVALRDSCAALQGRPTWDPQEPSECWRSLLSHPQVRGTDMEHAGRWALQEIQSRLTLEEPSNALRATPNCPDLSSR